jgi:DNA-3-methyladenine glycosylase II
VQATRATLGRLREHFGGVLPSPEALLAAAPEDLQRAGLSRRKIATLRELARQFADGRLSAAELERSSDKDIEARLTAIPGIGPWTVHGFLIIALAREDVVLPGDLALRKIIQRVYQLDHLPSQDEVRTLADRWRPYRSLATSYLFQTAFEPPA